MAVLKEKFNRLIRQYPLWSGLVLGFFACLIFFGIISLFSVGSGDGFANADQILKEDYLRMAVSEYAFTRNQPRAIWRYDRFEDSGSAYLNLLKKDPLTDPLSLLEFSRVVGDYSLASPDLQTDTITQPEKSVSAVQVMLWILTLLLIAAIVVYLLMTERGRDFFLSLRASINRLLRRDQRSDDEMPLREDSTEPLLRKHPTPEVPFATRQSATGVVDKPEGTAATAVEGGLRYESVSADWFEEQKTAGAEPEHEQDETPFDEDTPFLEDAPFWQKLSGKDDDSDLDIPNAEEEDAAFDDDLSGILEDEELPGKAPDETVDLSAESLRDEEDEPDFESVLELDETIDADAIAEIEEGKEFSEAEIDGTAFTGPLVLEEPDEDAEELFAPADLNEPLIHYQATYKLGDDFFDETFSLDDKEDKFIGECGIGIAETINNTDPKAVTAFEIWLFDRDDVHTPTHFLLSDFAYTSEVMLERLKNKGRYDLIEVDKPYEVLSETLKMIVVVTELEYGTGSSGKRSYFNKAVFDVRVWQLEP